MTMDHLRNERPGRNALVPFGQYQFNWLTGNQTNPPRYPYEPGYKSLGASQEAAQAIAPIARNLRQRVLTLVQSLAPDEALTADQIAIRLQRSPLSIRPRVSELVAAGKIHRAAERGKNESGMSASRWRIAGGQR